MKKINAKLIAATIFCLTTIFYSNAQNFNNVRSYFDELDQQIYNKEDTLLMSYPALNVFMAKKVNTYLTGSSDLSLNKSYFVIDPTDGRLFLGYNISKDPSIGSSRTKFILTTGIKSNLTDAFSTIYTGNKNKISNNIGLSLKFTFLGRGVVFYDKKHKQIQIKNLNLYGLKSTNEVQFPQKEIASFYRSQLQIELDTLMKLDSASFENEIRNVGSKGYQTQKRKKFYDDRTNYYRSQYITKEFDNIDEESIYNSIWNHWISLELYIPFTKQEFEVADNFSSSVNNISLYNFESAILWSHIYETEKVRWFGSVGLGAKALNNINTSLIDKYSIGDYKKISGTDTLKLAELEANDIYIGKYSEYITPFMRAQFVGLFIAKKQIGLSFFAEKYLSTYKPLNIKAGVPFNLKGKDDDTKVNFELQFKWNDVDNSLFPDKTRMEKFVIGLSVGVPLTSKIY